MTCIEILMLIVVVITIIVGFASYLIAKSKLDTKDS
jgi:hypothetical protein